MRRPRDRRGPRGPRGPAPGPGPLSPPPAGLRIAACGAEQAEAVHRLTRAAFGELPALDPPSGALRETLEDVRADLANGGRATLAWLGGRPVGCVRYRPAGGQLHARRLAVEPGLQGRGIGGALMTWVEAEAGRLGLGEVTLGVRLALPDNLALYRHLGYEIVSEHSHPGYGHPTWVSMRKRLR